ncbi:hypothetical protein LAT59_01465 [Candidatus Gracilibacteria bacterium]|nr:hypothetical protein [Candidatus Gracilibacteria bacterium]
MNNHIFIFIGITCFILGVIGLIVGLKMLLKETTRESIGIFNFDEDIQNFTVTQSGNYTIWIIIPNLRWYGKHPGLKRKIQIFDSQNKKGIPYQKTILYTRVTYIDEQKIKIGTLDLDIGNYELHMIDGSLFHPIIQKVASYLPLKDAPLEKFKIEISQFSGGKTFVGLLITLLSGMILILSIIIPFIPYMQD